MADVKTTFENQVKELIKRQRADYTSLLDQAYGHADPAHSERAVREARSALDQITANEEELLNLVRKDVIVPGQIDLAKKFLLADPLASQAVDEFQLSKQLIAEQNDKLSAFRNRLETQYFGAPGLSLSAALANPQGDIGQLGEFLRKQESETFRSELAPLLNMQLGAQGLHDSGANIELQSKALGQLERERQGSLMEAALGARSQVQGLAREDLLGDIGSRQAQLSNVFDLQRQSISMNFQRELERQRADLARELSSKRGSSGLGGILGMGGGMAFGGALGFMAGGPAGAALGAGIGGGFGGGIGNYLSPNDNFAPLMQLPSTLTQAGGFLSRTGDGNEYGNSGLNRRVEPGPNYPGSSYRRPR